MFVNIWISNIYSAFLEYILGSYQLSPILKISDFRGKRKAYEPPSNDNSEDGFDPEQGEFHKLSLMNRFKFYAF